MDKLKFVCISDIHIGNDRIRSLKLYNNFRKYLHPQLVDCNILFINGDFFDSLISIDNEHSHYVILIVSELFQLANEYGFKIRVTRGTFLHDRLQNRIFGSIHKNFKKVNYQYYDKISFEEFKKENLRILYIPDNLSYKNSDDCIFNIKDKLKNLGWEYLDLVMGHGYFKHVLPPNIPKEPSCTFNENQFKNIVKGFINFGHVHSYSAYKNIVYNGSFERFRHGEEEAKGFIVIEKNKDKYSLKFIENKDANIFLTINLKNIDIENSIIKFKQIIKNKKILFPLKDSLDDVYIRILHNDAVIRNTILVYLKDAYKEYNVVFTDDGGRNTKYDKITIEHFKKSILDEVVPTKDNIYELMSDFLKNEYNYNIFSKKIITLINDLN